MANLQSNPRKPKQKTKPTNPIETAISTWLIGLAQDRPENIQTQDLLAQAPKRWVTYEPMVLLPSGSFTSPQWLAMASLAGDSQMRNLWASILSEITKKHKTPLTHLAVNEGIPLHTGKGGVEGLDENILRSPSGLRMLYGDFGSAHLQKPGSATQQEDFDAAFWVSTKQNGVLQTWAPRWTMFSRGNITEKARLLDFHHCPRGNADMQQHRVLSAAELRDKWAVDLYAGIGYFVFSYAKLGMRVLCWEINPWSVEGLRRGAALNGWSIKVVQGAELEKGPVELLGGGEEIVVFLEDNRVAVRRLRELHVTMGGQQRVDILHVNCGFLPTSELVWNDAWEMVQASEKAWLHLHENVGVADIETRKAAIQKRADTLIQTDTKKAAKVEHVELVKTFAPGVWHCVFDVYIS